MRLFVDTTAWFDHVDRDARNHDAIDKTLTQPNDLYTSDYIVDETLTLIRVKLGHPAAVMFGSAMFNGDLAQIVEVSSTDRQAAWDLFRRRSDKRLSFTACTSFILMKRLDIDTAVSSDRDFEREGFKTLPRAKH